MRSLPRLIIGLVAMLLARSAAAGPPNVLFLLSDDQRADTIGAYGNPHIRTPHLDALAVRGFNFRRAYCMGSIHGAVCQPSRAMIMSGRTLYRVPMALDDVPILPEILGRHGYATFGTGKWHNGRPSFKRAFAQGAAVFFGGMSDHERVPVEYLKEGALTDRTVSRGFSSELFADAAIAFLRTHDAADGPFFAYVSFTAPHDPRTPPGDYRAMYESAAIPLPLNYLPQHPFHNGWMTGRDEVLLPWPRPRELVREQLAEYYGMVSHLDAQIGRIFAALEEAGHADDTIVVFASDHGLAMGSHGLLGKQSLYEHSMRTPMIVAGPGVPAGSSDALVYLHDLMPTLCEVAGTPAPDSVEGRTLAPVWRGEARAVRTSLFTTYEDIQRAVRDDRYKIIRYPRIDRTQLFDLVADPDERFDLAGNPAHADRVERMMTLLAQWQERVADPHPLTAEVIEPEALDLTGRARKADRHQPTWVVDKYFR